MNGSALLNVEIINKEREGAKRRADLWRQLDSVELLRIPVSGRGKQYFNNHISVNGL